VREAFGVEIPLRAMFESPTIAQLSQSIENVELKVGDLQSDRIQRVPRA
jgi:hypothetical protein